MTEHRPEPGLSNAAQQDPRTAPTNTLAIVAFISSFFVSLAGIICGHIALTQIKRSGERGRGLALAGLIIGYVSIGLTIASIVILIVFGALAVSAVNEASTIAAPTSSATVSDEPSRASGYSAEFCDALTVLLEGNEAATEAGTTDDPETVAAELDSYLELSQIDSPHQELYERAHAYLEAPSSDTLGTLGTDVPTTLAADAAACGIG